jgi:hypothetical protein
MQPPSEQDIANNRLIDAAACGCVLQIRHALQVDPGHATLDATDARGNSALHVAAMHGHAEAVLLLETMIQPALRNREGKTSVEVWCCELSPPHPQYPDRHSVQRGNVERHRKANAMVGKLESHLQLASDVDGWRRYLADWKAIGRLDSHANSVLMHMLTKMQMNTIDLPRFANEESLHSLSMLFELLATFAQESFCLLVKASLTAPAIIHDNEQRSALRFLADMEIMFESAMNAQLLGIELFTSVQLLKNAVQSFSLVAAGNSFGRMYQRKLQSMGFELLLGLGSLVGAEIGNSIRHACNLASLMLAEVSTCESNDWMTATCEMHLASLGSLHEDFEKSECSFLILQRHLRKYTSFFGRRHSLLLQGVTALYRIARFSPHPSIRLKAAFGCSNIHPQRDSPPPQPPAQLVALPVLFKNGDEVVLVRRDNVRSTRLRKVPTASHDDSVWSFPTIKIFNNDKNCKVTFLRHVPSQRPQDSGILFALVRVQPRPPVSEFSRNSSHSDVQAVEGYVQLLYLRLVKRVSDERRSPSPPPPPTPQADDDFPMTISIKTLTCVSCFFRRYKNDRVRALASLMMLRLHYNLPSEGADDPNNAIVATCIDVLDAVCSSSDFDAALKKDLDHLRKLRQPGHAIASAALHDDSFDPIDPILDVSTSIRKRTMSSVSAVAVDVPRPARAVGSGGSGAVVSPALDNARLLWQMHNASPHSEPASGPSAPLADSVAAPSAPPMDSVSHSGGHAYAAAALHAPGFGYVHSGGGGGAGGAGGFGYVQSGVGPVQYAHEAPVEAPLPPHWMLCRDIEGKRVDCMVHRRSASNRLYVCDAVVSGKMYFWNRLTNVSQWERPLI